MKIDMDEDMIITESMFDHDILILQFFLLS